MENYIINVFGLIALYLSYRFLKHILLWGFRQEMFSLRDNLFAMQFLDHNEIDYDLYHIMRNCINSRIRYAHKLTFVYALLMRKVRHTEAFNILQESKYSVAGLRKELEKINAVDHLVLLDEIERKTAVFFLLRNIVPVTFYALYLNLRANVNVKNWLNNGLEKIEKTTNNLIVIDDFDYNNEPRFV